MTRPPGYHFRMTLTLGLVPVWSGPMLWCGGVVAIPSAIGQCLPCAQTMDPFLMTNPLRRLLCPLPDGQYPQNHNQVMFASIAPSFFLPLFLSLLLFVFVK